MLGVASSFLSERFVRWMCPQTSFPAQRASPRDERRGMQSDEAESAARSIIATAIRSRQNRAQNTLLPDAEGAAGSSWVEDLLRRCRLCLHPATIGTAVQVVDERRLPNLGLGQACAVGRCIEEADRIFEVFSEAVPQSLKFRIFASDSTADRRSVTTKAKFALRRRFT